MPSSTIERGVPSGAPPAPSPTDMLKGATHPAAFTMNVAQLHLRTYKWITNQGIGMNSFVQFNEVGTNFKNRVGRATDDVNKAIIQY